MVIMESVLPIEEDDPRVTRAALLSLGLGILSNLILPIIGSIPAIFFGLVALKRIKHSSGEKSGRMASLAGIFLGISGIFVGIILLKTFLFPATNHHAAEANQMAQMEKARVVIMACEDYAIDHDGNFPEKLADLSPDYLKDSSALTWRSITGEEMPFRYFPGASKLSAQNRYVIASPMVEGKKRVVGLVDGTVEAIKEIEFRAPK